MTDMAEVGGSLISVQPTTGQPHSMIDHPRAHRNGPPSRQSLGDPAEDQSGRVRISAGIVVPQPPQYHGIGFHTVFVTQEHPHVPTADPVRALPWDSLQLTVDRFECTPAPAAVAMASRRVVMP